MTESTTRQRMVETAARLIQREGYTATSWRRLVDEAGTPWGSAYHHFRGGKEQLGVAAVEHAAGVVRRTVVRAFERHDDPVEAIRWWYGKAAGMLRESGYQAGCPIATVALEATPSSPALVAASRAAFEGWLALLTGLLAQRRVAQPDRAARAVVINLEGALLLARVLETTTPLDAAAEQVARMLARS